MGTCEAAKPLGRSLGDHLPALVPSFRPQVDDPIGGLDHVQIVLDDDDGVAGIRQAVKDVEQALDIGEVQAGGGLIQDVERPARGDPSRARATA